MRAVMKIWSARICVLLGVMASVLVPAWASPTRIISIPQTEAKSMKFSGPHLSGFRSGIEHFSFPPSNLAFVWTGDNGTQIRYRSTGADAVSRWRAAQEDVDLQHGDVHYSGVLAVEGITGIQWRAVVPAGAHMGGVTIDYMNTLDGPRVFEQIPALAEARAKTPQIVTRAEWGADESIKRIRGGCQRQFYPVQQLFVHHTAGTNHDPHPKATMRAIYYFHTVVRGWCDIGYNFVIGPDGTIYEGRWARNYSPWETHTSETRSGKAVMGAHVLGFNAGSVGISLMGNYSLIHPPAVMRNSLAKLLAWEADRHNLQPRHRHTYNSPISSVSKRLHYIAGHRDANATSCPGNYLYAALPAIRRHTATIIGAGKKETSISLDSSPDVVKYHGDVTLSGTLTRRSGRPIPSARVHIYRRRAPYNWRDSTVTTAPDGTFSIQVAPRSEMVARAVYGGSRRTWGSESRLRRVLVMPQVSLSAVGGVVDDQGIVHYPAGTTTVSFAGAVKPAHPGLRVRVRVVKYEIDGGATRLVSVHVQLDPMSQFGYDFSVPDPATGQYRAVAKFPSDGDHTSATSDKVFFSIDP
jgi:N-acetylmuramoyl-L-alanine amidase